MNDWVFEKFEKCSSSSTQAWSEQNKLVAGIVVYVWKLKTPVSTTHKLSQHQLYLIACSVWTKKKEQTSIAHHWYFIRNGWYLEKGEGGDRKCARGVAEGCVQMGKGLIHTVTHSWKPVCRSPCLLQQPSKITLSSCNQWKSCWGKEVLSAHRSDGAGSHVSRSVFRTRFFADCTAGMIWTNTHGHSMFSHKDNVPDTRPQICIYKKNALCFWARISKCFLMGQRILSKSSRTGCVCEGRWQPGFGEG